MILSSSPLAHRVSRGGKIKSFINTCQPLGVPYVYLTDVHNSVELCHDKIYIKAERVCVFIRPMYGRPVPIFKTLIRVELGSDQLMMGLPKMTFNFTRRDHLKETIYNF